MHKDCDSQCDQIQKIYLSTTIKTYGIGSIQFALVGSKSHLIITFPKVNFCQSGEISLQPGHAACEASAN